MPEPSQAIGMTPYLTLPDAAAAIDFYAAAFGAKELVRHTAPDGGRIMHARLEIFGSTLMLSDDFPEFCGGRSRTPAAYGGCPIVLSLQVEDADAIWAKATAAGAEVVMPLQDQFWGDRYGQLRDPYGYTWSVGQRIAEPSAADLEEGAARSWEKAAAH